ncbi:MAG: glycoside hydrolase family 3 C-terminal domain-containing protein [Oscillospiraceae bacterium]|jgi:beta-glucosidase|nr:glycoside hydrolase family 3 C-terminal domain-containing protein [Oscillospiraceae bacterium]
MNATQKQSAKDKAEALVAQMTPEEICFQLRYDSKAVERLGIPEYNYWNEALHGVARAGTATSFPQAIALAAMFDAELLFNVADAISTEGRAKYNAASNRGDRDIYKGLTFWSPNINIFRDPRWGRGHETYGEDPYLTAKLGVAFVNGMQGDGDTLKTAACAKHYAVHSGPESLRHEFNAVVNKKDLWETYLPAFEALVTEAEVEAVMGAYNATLGEPCCASNLLLGEILRGKWEFDGHVVSDCWAIADFHNHHKVTNTPRESAALALNAGCDLNCGNTYLHLLTALQDGLITEDALRRAAVRVLTTRFRLGILGGEGSEYDAIPYEANDSAENHALEQKAALESMVLLKNEKLPPTPLKEGGKTQATLKEGGKTQSSRSEGDKTQATLFVGGQGGSFLPLNKSKLKNIAVIGPNADSRVPLKGNYYGTSSEYITVLDGIRRVAPDVRVHYSEGCHLYRSASEFLTGRDNRLAEAIAAADASEVVVLVLGLDETIEGEEGFSGDDSGSFDVGGNEFDQRAYFESDNNTQGGDKKDLNLPKPQRELLDAILKTGKPVVLVLMAGSSLDLRVADAGCKAILNAWYPGGRGGLAVAKLLFGEASPCGKLPVTFYNSTDDLPDFLDYAMANRTYRYFKGEVLYPFGYGLTYGDVTVQRAERRGSGYISAAVSNIGIAATKDVVQVYYKADSPFAPPNPVLCGFAKTELAPGEARTVEIALNKNAFTVVNDEGDRVAAPSGTLFVGIGQPDARTAKLTGKKAIEIEVK